MGSEHYCLRWNNHQSNLLGVFSQLLQDESLVDVTLACAEGHSIRAHKVVLSACSSYFQTLFVDHPSRHPIVILKDVRFAELRTLVEFMYKGEVNVEYCQLSALLKTAESLKVKGLAEMTGVREGQKAPETPRLTPEEPPVAGGAVKRLLEGAEEAETPSPSRRREDSDNDSCDEGGGEAGRDDLSPCDMTVSAGCAPGPCSGVGSRLPSPLGSEPVPGPSGMMPVQQVPLSLKKEVDWDRGAGDDKSSAGDSSSDYRHPHDPEVTLVEGRYDSCAVVSAHRRPLEPPFSSPSSRSSTPAFPFPFPFAVGLDGDRSLLGLLQRRALAASPALSEDRPLSAGLFRCAVCLAAFPSAWLLEQHCGLQHSLQCSGQDDGEAGEDKPFRCEQCGQSYRYRSAYLKHREQNHRARLPADKLFTCDVCGMQFRYLKSFKKHRLNHALERLHSKSPGEDLFARAARQNGSSGSSSPSPSLRSDYGDRVLAMMIQGPYGGGRVAPPPATSTVTDSGGSDQVSSTNESLEGPGVTPPVPRAGSSSGAEQDESADSLAFALSAAAAAAAAGAAGEALRSAHEASFLNLARLDAAERQRERRFACPFCGKCVRSKENLKLHVRKHTGERPFVCLFCGRAFGGKSDLTRHLRIHTGERPYHCEMCGKCFARADYLSKHLTTHIHNSQR
ncbi:zinc finger protein 837-like [Bacillus rossius redtenbacheri]|uniref:zinc finger protein 837-like n=1 Tax=Bacillus rossius redtenbacheri TaxID=93214 RepID=UPI002FDEEB5F